MGLRTLLSHSAIQDSDAGREGGHILPRVETLNKQTVDQAEGTPRAGTDPADRGKKTGQQVSRETAQLRWHG